MGSANIGSGAEFTFTGPGNKSFSEDFTATGAHSGTILLHFISGNGSYGASSYILNTDTTAPFSQVTLVSAGTSGFTSANIILTNGVLKLDLSGLSGTPSDITLSFTTNAAVTPEPSTFVLLGTGLLAGAGALRRRVFPRRS